MSLEAFPAFRVLLVRRAVCVQSWAGAGWSTRGWVSSQFRADVSTMQWSVALGSTRSPSSSAALWMAKSGRRIERRQRWERRGMRTSVASRCCSSVRSVPSATAAGAVVICAHPVQSGSRFALTEIGSVCGGEVPSLFTSSGLHRLTTALHHAVSSVQWSVASGPASDRPANGRRMVPELAVLGRSPRPGQAPASAADREGAR